MIKRTDGLTGFITGIKTGWRISVSYSDGTSSLINLEAFFASTQSVGTDNPNRLINWTEACRAVNSF